VLVNEARFDEFAGSNLDHCSITGLLSALVTTDVQTLHTFMTVNISDTSVIKNPF
jgi:hypothetical protein